MEANDSSENGTKRLKLPEKEDRISALPDPLIQHILSFLPSTEDSIRTGILSKRWKNQWAHVPVLIFEKVEESSGNDVDFARCIDNTLLLYECSKMKKFDVVYDFEKDKNFNSKLRFATRKDVEVLRLDFRHPCESDPYPLPNFIFDNAFLVELELYYCDFGLTCGINWPSLKALKMAGFCSLGNRLSIDNVVSGCLSLESLEVDNFNFYSGGVVIIASKTLKKLILSCLEAHLENEDHIEIEISCPNLEELSLGSVDMMVENVLSGSPLLHSLELYRYPFPQLIIVSKSLKKLDVYGISKDSAIEISCPNLEELILKCDNIEKCKLMNLPSSCCATLDFKTPLPSEGDSEILARKILKELQAFKELTTVGNWFVKMLSALEMRQPSYPLLNIKCLTLKHPNFENIVGIVNALRCSPALERLVIKWCKHQDRKNADVDLKNFEEYVTGFTCLVSHLKTVKIIGLSKRKSEYKVVLHFLGFLLKNAKALERMVVILEEGGGTNFLGKVSRKLLSFPRVSQHAIVELL